ncbi:uncharacterized protein LOC111087449 [Limulus polyphemus]|uniref:Glycosyltransferase family 92 protein n=1 Tax=Limulus polyphemus TaxID=6850 RepID=A0ABM1T1P6_LIMPO|nr:uncharacterized protein LOC111087449 [Limulus polyphemus]
MFLFSTGILLTVFKMKNETSLSEENENKPTQKEYTNKGLINSSRSFITRPQTSSNYYTVAKETKHVSVEPRFSEKHFINSQFKHQELKNPASTDWIQVRKGLCLYSAFWDDRKNVKNSPFIRIFGIFLQFLTIKEKEEYFYGLTCLLRSDGSVFPGVATMYNMDDPYDKNLYVVITCSPYNETSTVPKNVSIFYHNSSHALNWMPVTSFPGKSLRSKGRIAACVKPLYGPFTDKDLLAQFLAYYTIIGIDHFYIYNNLSSTEVSEVISNVKDKGVSITIIPWIIPYQPQITIQPTRFLERTMLQDCYYRRMFHYEYVMNVDVDEFIVLKQHSSIQLMLKTLSSSGRFGYFTFSEVRFCLQLPSYSNIIPNLTRSDQTAVSKLVSLAKVIRTPYNKAWWWRKYIVKPEMVEYFGVHFVTKRLPGLKLLDVSPEIALMHHYRSKLCDYKSEKNVYDPFLPKTYWKKMLRYLRDWGVLQ